MLSHGSISEFPISTVKTSAAAPSSPPVPRSRAAMLSVVVAAWSVVTVAPLWGAVVLAQPAAEQVATHPSRTVEQASAIRAQWTEEAWPVPPRRRLVQPGAPVGPVDNPPFSERRLITHETLTWEAQTRPKLVQPTVVPVDNPPFSQRAAVTYELPTWDAQTRPKLVQTAVVTADNPPFGRRLPSVQGWYEPPVMESLWQATVTASSYQPDNPPFSLRHQPTVELLTWEAQTRPKLVQSTVVSVDNPPFSQRVVATYAQQTW